MLLEIIAGTHPAVRRAGAWFERHPAAALAVFAACMLLASVRW